MTAFNYKSIKNINLNFDKGTWNSETHNIVVSYDTDASKLKIKLISIYDEPITDLTLADTILKKISLDSKKDNK
jgi:hypothetical protein